jgi:hypothetical protein
VINLKELDKFLLDDFVKDIFIGFYQNLFFKNPGEFHYDPDDLKTKITIQDRFSYDALTTDFKPTIYTRRRPMGFMFTSVDQLGGMSLSTGDRRYTDLISGIMEIVSVSRVALEACRLAGMVFLLTQEFKQEFRKLGMHDISVKSLGEEEIKKARATIEIVEVPVTIQYVFQYTWMVGVMNSTPLKDIALATSSDIISGELKDTCTPLK